MLFVGNQAYGESVSDLFSLMFHIGKGVKCSCFTSTWIMYFFPHREIFVKPNGDLLQAGDTMKREKLGKTLELLAKEGATTFYTGKLADQVVMEIQEFGEFQCCLLGALVRHVAGGEGRQAGL